MSQAILKYLKEQQTEWATEFLRERIAFLRARRIQSGGQLSSSLEFEIRQEALQNVSELLLAFEDYGRFIDMKRLEGGEPGTQYIIGLMAWIREKGLAQQFTDRFVRKRKLKRPPANVLNQIAWGIVKKRQQRVRKRGWYNRSKSAAITELFNQVAAGLPDIVGPEIAKSLKK